MKTMAKLGALALFLGAAAVAVAGDCCGSKKEAKGDGGFNCQNACPLAQSANRLRSYGCEGSVVKNALANQVEKNLARI